MANFFKSTRRPFLCPLCRGRIHIPPILSGFLWKVINVFHAVDGMIDPDTHLSGMQREVNSYFV